MEDGSYDIFGNAIPADGVAASAPATEVAVEISTSKKKSGVGWTPPACSAATPPAAQSGFAAGAAVEVKEGGSKWRAGTVMGADAKAKTVDVKYDDDGEIEPEIPANLVRLREGVPPTEQAAKAATSARKERTRVSRQAVKDCLKNPKVVSILEIVSTLSERELDSAVAMMRALDAVRAQPDGLAAQSS